MPGINSPEYLQILEKLKNSRSVLITSHVNPDGDNISSCASLAMGLEKLGKKTAIALNSPVPYIYKFMQHTSQFISFQELENSRQFFDCAMVLDVGNLKRVGETTDLKKFTELILNIDHHVRTEMCGHISFVDSSYSSTAEIIYNVLLDLNVKIDRDIADNLYVGIMTDTGNFQFQNTTASALRTAGALVELGASPEFLNKKVYFSNRPAKILLMGKVLANLKFTDDYKIGWISATKEIIDNCGASSDDLENVINNVTSVDGIEVAILFRDLNDGTIKLSLRARGNADVQKYALKYGGGGHKKASGMVLNGKLDFVVNKVISEMREHINDY
ncbi:MAG: bifunctional oligoribonuclease/PAP phosphatase NrnA [Candidatus Wallbacteria bacterium]